jgi:effector-binding domain-containing protein
MKKIIIFVLLLMVIVSIWYVFFKSYDYQVTFQAKTSSGTVFQGIKIWSEQLETNEKITSKTRNQIPFNKIEQEILLNENTFLFDWNIMPINDSLTNVKVGIIDTKNKFSTRLKVPFIKTELEEFSVTKLTEFKKGLDSHLKNFKIKIERESQIPETFCAYLTIESSQANKAMNMIKNNTFISQFLAEKNLKTEGYPFIEVTSWDIPNENIIYNFCFPIEKSLNLPVHPEIKFKTISAKNALKATYFGNYRTSDRAWYALIEFATQKNIQILHTPVEFFYNNPMHGGDELKWKAEVFLPLNSN